MLDPGTYNWVSLLIKACYYSPAVMSVASRISPENLMQFGATYVQSMLFAAVLKHWQTYNTVPMYDQIKTELVTLFQSIQYQFGQAAAPHLEELKSLAADIVQPLQGQPQVRVFSDLVGQIYRKTVGDQLLTQAASEAVMSGNYAGMVQRVNSLSVAAGSTRGKVDNFMSKKLARPSRVIRSGIDFIDSMLGGGFRAGNGYGVLAPTGGGKTTFAGQIACSMALQGSNVALVFTEQSMDEPELKDRFWALATGKPSKLFEPFDDEDQFPPDLVNDGHRLVAKTFEDHIQVYDFSKQPGNMSEIRAIAAGASDKKPDIILIDWAGQFAKQLIQARDPLADTETNALKHIADECAVISREYQIPVVVFHQLRPDCQNPTASYSHTDANMCKQFFFNLSYALVIHPRDNNDVLVIRTTKGRWIHRGEHMAVLRGELARFEGLTGYQKGRGSWVKQDDLQKVPSEKKAQRVGVQWSADGGFK